VGVLSPGKSENPMVDAISPQAGLLKAKNSITLMKVQELKVCFAVAYGIVRWRSFGVGGMVSLMILSHCLFRLKPLEVNYTRCPTLQSF